MLYRDIWDQKPPGIHLTYAAAFAIFGAHDRTIVVLDAIAATVACAFVVVIALRLRPSQDPDWDGGESVKRPGRMAWASAIAFAIGTYPSFALPYGGFLERAVPETFITALAAAAAWCALRSRFALAGLAIGAAAIFKPTALIYWPVMALVGAMVDERGVRGEGRGGIGEGRRRALRAAAVSGGALLVPIAAVIVWLWANGALVDAKIAVFDYNRAYVVAGSSWLALPNIVLHELWRLVKTDPLWCAAAIGVAAGIWDLRPGIGDRESGIGGRGSGIGILVMWLAAAVIAAAANGVRMYATYFLPTAAPLALLAGSLFDRDVGLTVRRGSSGAREGGRYSAALLPAAAVVLAAIVAVHSHYPDRLARYTLADLAQLGAAWRNPSLNESTQRVDYLDGSARRASHLDGSARRAAYLEMFGGYANGRGYSARANEELSSYLRAHTNASDRLYIFGMAPAVYFDAQRLPANRFIWTFPAVSPFAGHPSFTIDALAADLERAAPAAVVLERNNRDSATGWRIEDVYAAPQIGRLLASYTRDVDIEDFTVLHRSSLGIRR